MESYFDRTIQAIGPSAFDKLQNANIILFGAGGVGGWCAEALVRTGVKHLTIVDFDIINPSNINRQLVAMRANIGLPKVEQLRKRLLNINPEADITVINERYCDKTAELFDFNQYDYVLDAIDSVPDKTLLTTKATRSSATFFASMGAGRKYNPGEIRVGRFNKVYGCPLARALRHHLKSYDNINTSFTCVWSPEISTDSGTIAPVVMTFGATLAGLVINDIIQCK